MRITNKSVEQEKTGTSQNEAEVINGKITIAVLINRSNIDWLE